MHFLMQGKQLVQYPSVFMANDVFKQPDTKQMQRKTNSNNRNGWHILKTYKRSDDNEKKKKKIDLYIFISRKTTKACFKQKWMWFIINAI